MKLKMSKKYGATHTINSRRSDLPGAIRKIVGKRGVDVAVDNTGAVEIIQAAYEVTADSGRTVLVGVPPEGQNINTNVTANVFEYI